MLAEAVHGVIAALIVDEWRWTLRLFDVPRQSRRRGQLIPAKPRERVLDQHTSTQGSISRRPNPAPATAKLMACFIRKDVAPPTIVISGDNELPELIGPRAKAAKARDQGGGKRVCARTARHVDQEQARAPNTFGRLGDGR